MFSPGGPDQDIQPLPRPRRNRSDIQKLRDLHVEMDKAVAAAYGWDDLDLGHGFHETKQGTRFTISESARREVLARLLKLNHERYAEEVKQGLHEKGGGRRVAGGGKKAAGRSRKSKASAGGPASSATTKTTPTRPKTPAAIRPPPRSGPHPDRPGPTSESSLLSPPNLSPARFPST